ncbi:DNA polymerase alpha subunit B [Nematocida sp. AWRm80]|nr:DNA polymerase alpha subunit B [Nematocida sp. AWRm80]
MRSVEELSLKALGIRSACKLNLRTESIPKNRGVYLPTPNNVSAEIRRRIEQHSNDTNYSIDYSKSYSQRIYVGMCFYNQENQRYHLLCVNKDLSIFAFNLLLNHLTDYSLYTGQIVAIEGINKEAEDIEVINILYDKEVIEQDIVLEKNIHLNLQVVNGTVTEIDLSKVLTEAKQNRIDLLVLIGDLSLEERTECQKYCKENNLKTVLIPVLDGLYSTMVYPTEYLQPVTPLIQNRVFTDVNASKEYFPVDISNQQYTELINPSMISVNGIIIGITSLDLVLGVSSLETSIGRVNRSEDILAHIGYQGTFLPFLPSKTPVQYDGTSRFIWRIQPHILITPTKTVSKPIQMQFTHIVPVNTPTLLFTLTSTSEGVLSLVFE